MMVYQKLSDKRTKWLQCIKGSELLQLTNALHYCQLCGKISVGFDNF